MVRVEPATLPWMEALMAGDDVFAERFGIPVVEGWAEFPEAIPAVLEAVRSRPADQWGTHLIFDDDGALVGFGGWKGKPRDGVVELGYAVAPERRGKGIATAVVSELVARAVDAGATMVTAHTLAETNPSTRVLARCGFELAGEVADPDGGVDGPVWRWELRLAATV